MHKYEIEIKSLLGSKERADELISRMKQKDLNLKALGSHKQLNHYFMGGDLKSLYYKVQDLLDDSSMAKLKDISVRATDFSVRTREADGKVILVVKATVDDTTSSNGTARLEFEAVIPTQAGIQNIHDLDKLALSAGFSFQAKWSRERSEYKYTPLPNVELSVSTDKNAGYGYLAEFEMVVDDKEKANDAKNLIRVIMGDLEVDELPQDRLARMFDFYNQNWQDYYGTEKTFNIE